MIPLIDEYRAQLAELCRRYHVQRLELFGSAASGAFMPESSDFDFIVQFQDPGSPDYATRYLRFAESLEALFHRPVDLLIDQPFSNPYFREAIEEVRRTVYESRNEKAVV